MSHDKRQKLSEGDHHFDNARIEKGGKILCVLKYVK